MSNISNIFTKRTNSQNYIDGKPVNESAFLPKLSANSNPYLGPYMNTTNDIPPLNPINIHKAQESKYQTSGGDYNDTDINKSDIYEE